MTVEAWLDDTPGETRGIVARNGRFTHLLIQREDDVAAHRLAARSVGRVVTVEPSLKGAFVDLGVEPHGFLALKGGAKVGVGAAVEVEVTAEPRVGKGPALALIGPGQGPPRLVAEGPSVTEQLVVLAPGVEPAGGAEAIRAGIEAVEEALTSGAVLADVGLDLSLDRTRALIAVDIDLAAQAGVATGKGARDRANRAGLMEAARLIGLKGWGGLVAIDLAGVGHDGETVERWAREAFGGDPAVAYGPVNKFGVLMLSLPWRGTPVEERLGGAAQEMVRRLRLAMLSETTTARFTLRAAPAAAEAAKAWVDRLGPRAHLIADPKIASGAWRIEE